MNMTEETKSVFLIMPENLQHLLMYDENSNETDIIINAMNAFLAASMNVVGLERRRNEQSFHVHVNLPQKLVESFNEEAKAFDCPPDHLIRQAVRNYLNPKM
jgi:hypothetical protein